MLRRRTRTVKLKGLQQSSRPGCCGNSAAKDSPPAAVQQSGDVAPPSEQPAAELPCKKSKPAAEPPCKKRKSQKASATARKTQSKTAGAEWPPACCRSRASSSRAEARTTSLLQRTPRLRKSGTTSASTRMGILASRNLLVQEIKASRFSPSAPLYLADRLAQVRSQGAPDRDHREA